MDAKTLVIGMTLTLIFVFIYADRYRKREVELMRLEGEYFESVKKWHSNPDSPENQKLLKQSAKEFGLRLGMLESEIEEMISRDMSSLSK